MYFIICNVLSLVFSIYLVYRYNVLLEEKVFLSLSLNILYSTVLSFCFSYVSDLDLTIIYLLLVYITSIVIFFKDIKKYILDMYSLFNTYPPLDWVRNERKKTLTRYTLVYTVLVILFIIYMI